MFLRLFYHEEVDLYRVKVKKVALVFRPDTPEVQTLIPQVTQWLKARKIEVFSHPDQRIEGVVKLPFPDDLDLVIVLGGDGTYLAAVRMLQGTHVPLLGFNLGTLGFLTVAGPSEIFPILEKTLKGDLEIRHRSMIRVHKVGKAGTKESWTALNDVVIGRGSLSRLISITVSIDGQPMTCVKADGLILATPTGSSAYNVSCGGPLMHPELAGFVLTPISSHSLTSRPFVYPDDRAIMFKTDIMSVLIVDGVAVASLNEGEEVVAERDVNYHLFLATPGVHFINVIKEKLKFGESA